MDIRVFAMLGLLMPWTLLALGARAGGYSRSVVFFESPPQTYIRNQPFQKNIIQLDEVAAAVSVLLGLAPPSSLTADSSSKLNEVLLPNPFDRPGAVFLLEIGGIDGQLLSSDHSNLKLGSFFGGWIVDSKAKLHVPDEEDVHFIHIDEPECRQDDHSCLDKELSSLAQQFGGSYAGSLKSHDGKLFIPLSSGASIDLDLAKEADREFAMNLASFIENTMKAAVISDFSEASMRSAELFTGRFRGLEALKVEYGQSDITKLGAQLVMESLIMLFNTLQSSSRGSVVGVLVTNVDASAHTDNMIEVAQYARSSRWLDEINFDNETIVEIKQMVLVRRSLAWITGIILLVSTLIGICLLMNMPLTRDTLLYSNVKLD